MSSNDLVMSLIFVVTTIYAIFYGVQWNIMQSSMRLDQRAWIGSTIIKANVELGKPILAYVQFGNTGKTPAKEFASLVLCDIMDKYT